MNRLQALAINGAKKPYYHQLKGTMIYDTISHKH